jgi:hypothetical protein
VQPSRDNLVVIVGDLDLWTVRGGAQSRNRDGGKNQWNDITIHFLFCPC